MVQNLKKVLKSKISKFFSFLRHEVPFKAKNNREAVVVCAIHVVKRPSKRSVLVSYYFKKNIFIKMAFTTNLMKLGSERLYILEYHIILSDSFNRTVML